MRCTLYVPWYQSTDSHPQPPLAPPTASLLSVISGSACGCAVSPLIRNKPHHAPQLTPSHCPSCGSPFFGRVWSGASLEWEHWGGLSWSSVHLVSRARGQHCFRPEPHTAIHKQRILTSHLLLPRGLKTGPQAWLRVRTPSSLFFLFLYSFRHQETPSFPVSVSVSRKLSCKSAPADRHLQGSPTSQVSS